MRFPSEILLSGRQDELLVEGACIQDRNLWNSAPANPSVPIQRHARVLGSGTDTGKRMLPRTICPSDENDAPWVSTVSSIGTWLTVCEPSQVPSKDP